MARLKLFISGASGFLGQALIRGLRDEYEIHAMYEHEQSKAKNPELPADRQHIANLADKESLERVIQAVQPDIVIHLAAKTEVALSFDNYDEVSRVNYVGTVNLAEACRKFVPNFKSFIMASTMETYGHHDQTEGAFTEETEQRPMAPYAVAKLACEKYLHYMAYAYDFPYTIFRQTNAYGRTDNDFFVVERIITQMLKSDECNLGEPDAIRNFIYIDDLVDLYQLVLDDVVYNEGKKVRGETFCTGLNNALYIRDLATIIATKTGFTGTINWHTIPKRPGEIYYLNSSNLKATRVLGFEPKVNLSDGLDKTIAIWKENYGQEA